MENNNRLEKKIDNIQDSVHRIDITLAAQHISIKTHIKRTDLLEKFMFIIITAIVGIAFAVLHR